MIPLEPPAACQRCGAETERGLNLEKFGNEKYWVCHRCAPTRRRRTPLPPGRDGGSNPDTPAKSG